MSVHFQGFNPYDSQSQMQMSNEEFDNICRSHEGCKGCPMVGGKVYNGTIGQMLCETGANKKGE